MKQINPKQKNTPIKPSVFLREDLVFINLSIIEIIPVIDNVG